MVAVYQSRNIIHTAMRCKLMSCGVLCAVLCAVLCGAVWHAVLCGVHACVTGGDGSTFRGLTRAHARLASGAGHGTITFMTQP